MEIEEKVVLDQNTDENEQVESSEVNNNDNNNDLKRNRGNKRPRRAPNKGRKPKDDRFDEKVISINRVSKTVKGGKKMRFAALVAIGDHKGLVGFGTGKANEVPDAIRKALDSARTNLYKVPMVKGDTFKYEITGRYGAVKVFLKPAPVGTGIVAGGPVRAVLELAGIKNVYSKVYGSRTPINIVRATINAIESFNSVNRTKKLRESLASEEQE